MSEAKYHPGEVHAPAAGTLLPPIGGRAKRAFDLVLAVAALVSSVVVFLMVAVLVYAADPGPVLYAHRRVGFQGRSFPCLKFRTMVVHADEALRRHLAADETARIEYQHSRKLRDDPRIVPHIGHFLRRTSLDELPQFLNVLRGDMSFVGPRPVTGEEAARYGRDRMLYDRARPGITGLWQVSGRSRLAFEDRVALDCRYVRDWSFPGDLRILLRTFGVVAKRQGAC